MVIFRSFRYCNLSYYQRLSYKYCQKRCYSYEGDGKTTMTLMNREADDMLTIAGYNQLGFRLNSGLFVVGPVILFPKTVLSWNVGGDDDVNEDSLSLFYKLEPAVDLLVIGLGDNNSIKNQIQFMNKYKALKQTNLNFELLTTENAISTYNFLCIENRFVAAALIPPLNWETKSIDVFAYGFDSRMKGKDDFLIGDDLNEIEKAEKTETDKIKQMYAGGKKHTVGGFIRSLVNPEIKKFKKDE